MLDLRRQPDHMRVEFETLVQEHLDALYASAFRLTRNGGDAEDLVQDAVLRGFRFFEKFERGTNFRAWMFKILTNTFINRYRRSAKEHSIVDGPEREAVQEQFVSRSAISSTSWFPTTWCRRSTAYPSTSGWWSSSPTSRSSPTRRSPTSWTSRSGR
jgi:DNA-directed RNA polymerase specialized sigma24 family protein